nr:MAG: hypothetical protein [Bacteriophage sp.]
MIIKNNRKCIIKINGVNENGCEYCRGEKDISSKIFEDGSTYSDTIMQVKIAEEPLQKIKVLEVAPVKYRNGEPSKNTYHEFLINYCPMCGRKLNVINCF